MIISIHSAPDGKNPLWVRQAWIGLQLPCLRPEPVTTRVLEIDEDFPKSPFAALWRGITDGYRKSYTVKSGYEVSTKAAVGILSLHNEEAARWWIDNVRVMIEQDVPLLFDPACCDFSMGPAPRA